MSSSGCDFIIAFIAIEHTNQLGSLLASSCSSSVTSLIADINVGVHALKEGDGHYSVNSHDDRCDQIGDDKYNNQWRDWRLNIVVNVLVFVDNQVSQHCVNSCNHYLSKERDERAYSLGDHESGGMLQLQDGSNDSGLAEVVAGQSNLDVSIHVDVLHKFEAAIEDASHDS